MLSKSLYIYTHKIMSYYAPPITVIFVLGVVWQRTNSAGAATGFVTGMCIGTLRLLMEVLYAPSSGALGAFSHGNFLYFSACHGAFIVALVAVVSLATQAPPLERTQGLTWATRHQAVSGVMRQTDNGDLGLARESDGLEMPVAPLTHHSQDRVTDSECRVTDSSPPPPPQAGFTDDDDSVGLIRVHNGNGRGGMEIDRMSADLVLRFGGFAR
jgi:hypothetical protein